MPAVLPLLPLLLGPQALAAPAPASLGKLALQADETSLRLRFAGQLQAEADVAEETALSARVRRLRLGLDGAALDGALRTKLQLNLVPGATELLDAWGQARLSEGVNLRAGIFKVPFTRWRDQSYTRLVLSDWSIASKAFGAERQLGIAAHDGKPGRDAFGWSAGVFTGANTRASFGTAVAQAHGLALANASALGTGSGSVTLERPELVGRVTLGTPDMDAGTGFDHAGGPARVLVGLSGAWDLAPDRTSEFTGRAAAEALVKGGHLSAGAVAYMGLVPDAGDTPAPGALGGVGELAWVPHPALGLGLRYARVDVLPALAEAAPGRPWDRSLELAAGPTWFVHGTALALQADAGWLRTTRGDRDTDGARVRVQSQVVF